MSATVTETELPDLDNTTGRSRKVHIIDPSRKSHSLCGLESSGKTFKKPRDAWRHWVDCADCLKRFDA